ncbi:S41 family peptidase [Sinomicrobium weinanense]|uniref:Peptidase S41 n=1 Tax=Sinomicrobium weinanense TaxID=2842200 RepID=A0A926JUS9_9FLAO|nr:S41 family peptidase [Sinomicrobium weinanense]MBC9797942.1 peptidase S41 [Sinomicrobium weinanense]MBU3123266.1 peptidase S41 [Sinomicrobium weinanense]
MKICSTFFILVSLLWYSPSLKAQSNNKETGDSLSYFNKFLVPSEMQADLNLFREIREKMNSGLYRYRTKEQIDSIYHQASQSIKEPLPVTEFYKIILRLTDFEGSVHNYTEPGTALMDFLKRQKAFFPYKLTYINGQIIFDGQTDRVPAGSRIISINGIKDTVLMRSFYKYFPSDGYTITEKLSASVDKVFDWRYLLEYGLTDNYTLQYIAPGASITQKITLPAVSLDERKKNLKNRYSAVVTDLTDPKTQPAYGFKMVKPSTGLLSLRSFGMATGKDDPAFDTYVRFIDSVFTVLDEKNIPNLIIDIRNNPGGSDPTFEQPMMYLTDKPFKENIHAHIIFDPDSIPYEKYFWGTSTSERIDSMALENGRKFLKDYFFEFKEGKSMQDTKHNPVYYPKSPAFKGNLYLLINENVASAASHFASLVKAYARNVTIVGVETVGGYYVHNGHIPLVYELPNSKIKTKFSIVYVVQDAPKKPDQPDGRGIIPDYEVWPELDDFLKHRDTQMEFVLKLIE